jgi:hypothetical protein
MNKLLRLSFAGLLLLAGCSRSGDDPIPAPLPPTLLGTWTFQSERRTTTPKSGAAATTDLRPIAAGSITTTFKQDGTFASTLNGTTSLGTFTYSGDIITIPYTAGANGPKAQVLTVKELTANKLVTTEATEDTPNRYLTTDTYSR